MPRNGAGGYNLPTGNPVVTGTTIASGRENNTNNDLGAEIANSIAKDGQTTPTADLPMGAYRHTGVGSPIAYNQYATAKNIIDDSLNYVSTIGGTGNAITLAPTLSPNSYVAGQYFSFVATSANSGAVTVNVSAMGVKDVKTDTGNPLKSGDIVVNQLLQLKYNGTYFYLVNKKQELIYSTFADLKAETVFFPNAKYTTLCYETSGDGGANSFYYNSTSTATDNLGTIIQPTAITGAGRLLAINPSVVNVAQFGAKGDGATNDYTEIQAALTAAGAFGTVGFAKTSTGVYLVSQELKFYDGQTIFGYGGTSVAGSGCEIQLTTAASGVMSPDTPATTKYSGTIKDIYFNAQGFGDYGLSLYNCSYINVVSCAANTSKVNGCGLLLDSNVSLQCYFNIITGGRFFATGTGGAAIRFTRGANANTVISGKCGSSYCGMEFLASSAGNIIIGTDFEDNTLCHVYADSPSNIFQNLHMESCPIGYWLTTNATNTARIASSYASTVTTQVQDYSKTGSVLDTRIDTVSTKGDLRFGAAKFISNFLSGSTTLDYDPDLVSGTSNADFRMFLNTNTSGIKRILMYKGDGTTTLNLILNATGEVLFGDIQQENGVAGGVYRKTIRRAVAPTTGTWSIGDICNYTSPTSGGYVGAVCTTSGTPGIWKPYGLIT